MAVTRKSNVRFRERAELLDFLLEVVAVTSETLDLDQMLPAVADAINRVIPHDIFAILLYSERVHGLAIRYASGNERKTEIEVKSPLGNVNWSVLSLPFLWPLFKSARQKYEESADVVADAMKDGVKRLRKIDVNRYAKPIRKRWRAWTR